MHSATNNYLDNASRASRFLSLTLAVTFVGFVVSCIMDFEASKKREDGLKKSNHTTQLV